MYINFLMKDKTLTERTGIKKIKKDNLILYHISEMFEYMLMVAYLLYRFIGIWQIVKCVRRRQRVKRTCIKTKARRLAFSERRRLQQGMELMELEEKNL